MKLSVKIVSVVFVLLLMHLPAMSQVKANFENAADGTQNFGKYWGDALTSVTRAADPTARTSGVLKLSCKASTGDGKAAIGIDPLPLGWTSADAQGAKFFTFDLYLPADFPDSAVVKVWAQIAEGSWRWTDYKFSIAGEGNHIKAGKWITIHYPVLAMMETYADFKPWLKIKGGIEIYFPSDKSSTPTFSGDVLLDNFSILGVEPVVVADFTSSQANFGKYWGDALLTVAVETDPADAANKVLALACDASKGDTKAAIGTDPVNFLWTSAAAEGAYFATFKIWIPEGFPTTAAVKVWMQVAEGSWQWTDYKFSVAGEGERIKAGAWNTIHYPVKNAMDTWAAFQPWLKVKGGLEIYFGAGQTWTGKILVDDFRMHTLEVGDKWVVGTFDKASAGTQGFANNGWGAALTGVAQAADPSARTAGVLATTWDFSKAPDTGKKGSFENANINLGWTATDTGATKISLDVWVPNDAPLGAQISIFAMDHAKWIWTEQQFFLNDSTFKRGAWNTMIYDVLKFAKSGELTPTAVLTVGCQIYYNTPNNWAGKVYFDNFTLYGVKEPEGKVASPAITSAVQTYSASGIAFQLAHITWEDNTIGTETYNVYMSKSPISSVTAPGVKLIGNAVPHGEQYYNYRPYTKASQTENYYFAVTAVDASGTEYDLTDKSKAGPIAIVTSPTAKAIYVKDFATAFALDGLDNEFETYKSTGLKAERCNGTDTTAWTPTSSDMSWNATFVIDDNYLYISADVTDDDLNASGDQPIVSGSQAWMGDALEFYIGFYNAAIQAQPHKYKDVDLAGTGDWRIGFTAWGTTQKSGSADFNFPGVERTVYQKFTGDGYIIEARIALDSLAQGGDLKVVDGALLPLRIDGTDLDPSKGDTGRSLWTGWGNTANPEDWKRPATFGFLQVIGGPTAVNSDSKKPLVFALSNNYPNPFNPTTAISYETANTTTVRITVYDMLGKEVRTLVDGRIAAGSHTVNWDGKNSSGQPVCSGIYFCRMTTPEYSHVLKMTLLK
jgi:hypothetical protein